MACCKKVCWKAHRSKTLFRGQVRHEAYPGWHHCVYVVIQQVAKVKVFDCFKTILQNRNK